jgi:hypothetical protein
VDNAVELLDRQADFLLRQEDSAAFLIQIDPFLTALRSNAQVSTYLDDAMVEVIDIIEAMEEADRQLTSELLTLRREVAELCPEADDSTREPPAESDSLLERTQARLGFWGTLAYFDIWARTDPEPFNGDGEGGLANTLLGILRSKDNAFPPKDGAPDPLQPWRRRLANVQARYGYAVRLMRLRLRTSAGFALVKLEAVVDELNPPATDGDRGADTALFKLAWQQSTDDAEVKVIDHRVRELRNAVEWLHEDLRRRIGSTRSWLALVHRYRQRCEWHDRERMLAVAEADRRAGQPDDRLTGELARYLFDAGLSPLTRLLTGARRTDTFDLNASWYVEATQYGAADTRADILDRVSRVRDSVGALRGTPDAVREALCVIVRRDGPAYDLPAVLDSETYRLHLVLINLAPEEPGRPVDQPVPILRAEF